MNDQALTAKLKYIADYYKDKQFNKAIEEYGEAITALSRYMGGDIDASENLIEELADVLNMTEQVIYRLGCEDEVKEWQEYKINRTIDVIKAEIEKEAESRKWID